MFIIIKTLSDKYYAQNQINIIKTVHNERLANTVYSMPGAAAVLLTVSYAEKRRNR